MGFRETAGALLLLAATALGGPAGGSPRFQEATAELGLRFRHHHGGSGEFYLLETLGPGVVLFDYDLDGDVDVLFVDSGALPGYEGDPARTTLYRNDGGRFVDVTAMAGITLSGYGVGGVSGDVDGDGDPDLYLTEWGRNQLFLNAGDGTFAEAPGTAGAGAEVWSSSASLADADRDGDLDLYVANYVDFSFEDNPLCGNQRLEIRSYCRPQIYEGVQDLYYRNRGDGTFEEATTEAGLAPFPQGKGLGVLFGDVDGDDWPDLYVANDTTLNFLFRNRGDGTFEELGMITGTSSSTHGEPEAGMGVAMGDVNGDGAPEIMVTNFDVETNALYSHLGDWMFTDHRFSSRIAEGSVPFVGFGVTFEDLDNDADLDVVVANGHVIPSIEKWEQGKAYTYKQLNQLFVNDGSGTFTEAPNSGLSGEGSSRGLAAGDLDGDGDLDLVIGNSDDLAEAYRNMTPEAGHWLLVDLLHPASANVFGVGAKLFLEGPRSTQLREVRTASSYLSQSPSTAHFGLGAATVVGALRIRWPDGRERLHRDLPADRRIRMYRGS